VSSFYERCLGNLAALYPQSAQVSRQLDLFSPNLLCPTVIELSKSVASQAIEITRAFEELRQSSAYQQKTKTYLSASEQSSLSALAKNRSVLMSYDYHLDPTGQLKLIEINTNASSSLIVDLIYRTHGLQNGFVPDFQNEIMSSFCKEAAANGHTLKTAAIVDDDPQAQRLYIEFLMYQELFRKHGFECLIEDAKKLTLDQNASHLTAQGNKLDLVYNRHTDFYLQDESLGALRTAWLKNLATITPNTNEYALLADKQRLIELSSQTGGLNGFGLSPAAQTAIQSSLLETKSVMELGAEKAWSERKRYFFKPKNLFGGKAVYKGASISRTTFENNVLQEGYLAQEFVPAPAITIETTDGENGKPGKQEFKFDLRFYAYAGQVQLAAARVYRGQTTNFQTPGGGLAAIRWV